MLRLSAHGAPAVEVEDWVIIASCRLFRVFWAFLGLGGRFDFGVSVATGLKKKQYTILDSPYTSPLLDNLPLPPPAIV